jgi:hypothetical protein
VVEAVEEEEEECDVVNGIVVGGVEARKNKFLPSSERLRWTVGIGSDGLGVLLGLSAAQTAQLKCKLWLL